MSETPESQVWYRVAHLKPRLADRAEISRQIFRGDVWFVVRDPSTGKFNRLSESAYAVVGMMDGLRKVGEIWDIACTEFGDEAPTQDELLSILSQMNMLDLLITDGLPDAAGIVERGDKQRRRTFLSRFLNPLAVRFPLLDPDGIVTELWPLFRPFFSVFGALLYVVLLIVAAVTAGRHWEALTTNLLDRILVAESLVLLILVYPFVKLLHELGHAFAVKKYGGEVREVGLMFLVFIPVPYVDASAATAFPDKWKRVLVGSAGILVEVGLAAIALLLWTELEDGVWRALCFNIMVIGGVSTLIFNGNPLLRFDGYYVLSDLIEIPNLGARSNRYLGYLIQRHLFGIRTARTPVRAKGEKGWFVFYSIAAFIYRLFISFAIITLVATRFFVVGVLFAIWSVTLMFVLPIAKHLKFLTTSPSLRGKRGRAWAIANLAGGLVFLAAGFLPLPYRTIAHGIVHAPETATLVAGETGVVAEIVAIPNAFVKKGAPILRLADPILEAELAAAEADLRRFRLRYQQALSEDAFDVRLWRHQTIRSEEQRDELQRRIAGLVIRAPRDGQLVLPQPGDLPGRFLNRGDLIGYLVEAEDLLVRAAVRQETSDLIRRRTISVALRPAEDLDIIVMGKIVREVPSVGGALASRALSTEGGGPFTLDPTNRDGTQSLEQIMHFDIEPSGEVPSTALGARVYVRFDHGSEPLVTRLWRSIRQIFLERFSV